MESRYYMLMRENGGEEWERKERGYKDEDDIGGHSAYLYYVSYFMVYS